LFLLFTFPLLAGCVPDVDKLEQTNDIKGLVKALTYSEPTVSDAAAKALVEIGEPAVSSIIDLFIDGNSIEREKAVTVLIEIGEPTLNPLLAKLDSFSSNRIGEVAEIFGGIGEPAVDSLVELVNNSQSYYAIKVLGEIGNSRATQPIIDYLDNSTTPYKIEGAIEALGKIGAPEAVIPIINKIDRNIETNAIIIEALTKIGKPSIDILIHTIEDKNSDLHEKAAWVFVKLRAGNAEELLKYLKDEDTLWVYKLLIKTGDSGYESSLIEAIGDFGTEEMAEVYINSGNQNLKEAAIRWATSHNYLIYDTQGISGNNSHTNWGGGLGNAP